MDSGPNRHGERAWGRRWLAIILFATFCTYAASLGNGFPLDDVYQARAWIEPDRPNSMVRELRPLTEYFHVNYWHGAGDVSVLYRPVTVLSFAVTNSVFGGMDALPHRLLNLLLHLAATLLVFRLVRSFAATAGAVVAAALFGFHALHSEAVIAIVGRADLLAFCFGASSIAVYRGAATLSAWRRYMALLLAACLLFLAFCSKESALAWGPFLVVDHLLRPLRDRAEGVPPSWAAAGRAALLVAIPLAAFLLLRAGMIEQLPRAPLPPGPESNPLAWLPGWQRIAAATPLLAYGLVKTLLPYDLACYYGEAVFELAGPADARFLVVAAAILAVVTAAVRRLREWPLPFLAVAAFFGFSFLTSNVPFPIGVDFAERLYYQPSLGLAFVAGWAVQRVRDTGRRTRLLYSAGVWAAAVWCAWSVWLIQGRNAAWRDTPTLVLHDVAGQPRSCYLLVSAGSVLARAGEQEGAWELYDRAVQVAPQRTFALGPRGICELELGRLADAERTLTRAVELAWNDRQRAVMHDALGLVLVETPRPREAREQFAAALRLDPQVIEYRDHLLDLAAYQLSADEFERVLAEGERRDPEEPVWLLHRGRLALRRNEPERAERELLAARRAIPESPRVDLALAEAWWQLGQGDRVATLVEELLERGRLRPALRERARDLLRRARGR